MSTAGTNVIRMRKASTITPKARAKAIGFTIASCIVTNSVPVLAASTRPQLGLNEARQDRAEDTGDDRAGSRTGTELAHNGSPFQHVEAQHTHVPSGGNLYQIAVVVALAMVFTLYVRNSPFGLRLVAVRDNEPAATGLGVCVYRHRLAALALTSALTGLAGHGTSVLLPP